MKNTSVIQLLSFAIFLSSCVKDHSPVPLSENIINQEDKKEIITQTEWEVEDAIMHIKFSYALMGHPFESDTTYNLFDETEPCEKDLSFFFRNTGKLQMVEGGDYCGVTNNPDNNEYTWTINENQSKLILTGNEAESLLYGGNGSATLMSDTLLMDIIELNSHHLKTQYNVPEEEVFELAEIDHEAFELMNIKFSGNAYVTYTWKKK